MRASAGSQYRAGADPGYSGCVVGIRLARRQYRARPDGDIGASRRPYGSCEAGTDLQAAGGAWAGQNGADGVAPSDVEIRRQADMRYVGQSYELTIDMDTKTGDPIAAAVASFHSRHDTMYGHSNTAGPVEFVNLRTIHVHRPDERENPPMESASATAPKPVAHREAYFDGGFVKTPVYDRKHLSVGQDIFGLGDRRTGRHNARPSIRSSGRNYAKTAASSWMFRMSWRPSIRSRSKSCAIVSRRSRRKCRTHWYVALIPTSLRKVTIAQQRCLTAAVR